MGNLGKPRRVIEVPWPEDVPRSTPKPVEEPAWPEPAKIPEPAVPQRAVFGCRGYHVAVGDVGGQQIRGVAKHWSKVSSLNGTVAES